MILLTPTVIFLEGMMSNRAFLRIMEPFPLLITKGITNVRAHQRGRAV